MIVGPDDKGAQTPRAVRDRGKNKIDHAFGILNHPVAGYPKGARDPHGGHWPRATIDKQNVVVIPIILAIHRIAELKGHDFSPDASEPDHHAHLRPQGKVRLANVEIADSIALVNVMVVKPRPDPTVQRRGNLIRGEAATPDAIRQHRGKVPGARRGDIHLKTTLAGRAGRRTEKVKIGVNDPALEPRVNSGEAPSGATRGNAISELQGNPHESRRNDASIGYSIVC